MWPGAPVPKSEENVQRFQRANKEFYSHFVAGFLIVVIPIILEEIFNFSPRWPGKRTIVMQWYHLPILVALFYCAIRCVYLGFTRFTCPNCGIPPHNTSFGGGLSLNPKRCHRCDYPLNLEELEKDLAKEASEPK
jgi:hypothetical protein